MEITMYSTSWCADCVRARKYFADHNLDYKEIDIETDPSAAHIVEDINHGNRSVPTIVIEKDNAEKIITVEPSWAELEKIFN